jgi:hypothetical protein
MKFKPALRRGRCQHAILEMVMKPPVLIQDEGSGFRRAAVFLRAVVFLPL